MSIYFFCCINNKFNCLLVVFTTFLYSFFLPSFPWRYVWTVEFHNLLPFLTRFFFSCAVLFSTSDALTSRWSGFHSQWDFGGNNFFIYLFFYFSRSLLSTSDTFHFTTSSLWLIFFFINLFYFITLSCEDIFHVFLENFSSSQIIILRKIIEFIFSQTQFRKKA